MRPVMTVTCLLDFTTATPETRDRQHACLAASQPEDMRAIHESWSKH
jgi:hypothetical protein